MPTMPTPRQLPLLLLLAAAAWLGHGFFVEVRTAVAALAAPPEPELVWRWRLGDAGPAQLARFLAEVDPAARPGSLIALVTVTGLADQDHFLRLWAAYDLPRQRVVLRSDSAAARADYVVSYGTGLDEPRLTEVLRRPDGGLYRVEP